MLTSKELRNKNPRELEVYYQMSNDENREVICDYCVKEAADVLESYKGSVQIIKDNICHSCRRRHVEENGGIKKYREKYKIIKVEKL